MNSTQIQCFLTAARAKSFTEAADALFMSQPTFGRHIRTLEQELGFPLFVRGWKNYHLTTAGEMIYEGFLHLSAEYDALLTSVRKRLEGQAGQLTLGLLEGQLVDDTLRDLMQEYRSQYPNVSIELVRYSFGEMLDAVEDRTLDIGITLTFVAERRQTLHHIALCELQNDIVLPRTHPLAGKQGLSLKDFAQDTFIDLEKEDVDVISERLFESCHQAGFEPKVIQRKNLRSQITAVESGLGIAAFNTYHQTCNHPALVHIPLKDLPMVEFSAVWQPPFANPAAERFVELLRAKGFGDETK